MNKLVMYSRLALITKVLEDNKMAAIIEDAGDKIKHRFNINFILAALFDEDMRAIYAIDGKLPVDSPLELQYFKKVTTGHTVVMGRKTFESIGKPLPNRRNIVLSKGGGEHISHYGCTLEVEYYDSVERVLEVVQDDAQVFIIGGNDIWLAFKDYVNAFYISSLISPSTLEKVRLMSKEEREKRVQYVDHRIIPDNRTPQDEPVIFKDGTVITREVSSTALLARQLGKSSIVEGGFKACVVHRRLNLSDIKLAKSLWANIEKSWVKKSTW